MDHLSEVRKQVHEGNKWKSCGFYFARRLQDENNGKRNAGENTWILPERLKKTWNITVTIKAFVLGTFGTISMTQLRRLKERLAELSRPQNY